MTIRNLDKVLRPQSVALIGASGREGSLGHHLMRNLTADFKGPVMLVNPGHDEIQGRRCWRDVTALPSAPDLAVIATPAAAVPKVIADLGALGTRGAVVITAGLTRENGLRQAMLDAARPNLFRVIGPNCLGIAVPGARLNASFAHLAPAPGKLAFLSQSGALVGAVLDWAAGHDIGFSHVISMGDMADVDVGDLLDYLAGDPETSAILLYLETVTNPRKFLSAARSASRAKPVVAVKSGRHAAAAQAASTHTGALTVSDSVANAAFRRAGILRVEGLQDLFIAAEALARTTPLKGDRLAILTNGGGAGVLAVDKLMDLGGTLARLDAGTIDALGQQVPATWSHANPVDIIGDAGGERYTATLEILLDASDNDAVLVMSCPTALASAEAMAAAVVDTVERRRASRRPVKPVLTNWLGEPGVKAARARFAAAGIPTYDTPAAAVQSFADLVGYRKAQQALMRTPPLLPRDFSVDRDAVRSAIETVAAEGRALLTEPEAKAVLAAYGIDTVPTEVAATPVDAGRAAGRLLAGGTTSIALKILSRDISHKSDVGGVLLAIASPQEAEAAAAAMLQRVAARVPQARIDGFSVQPMITRPGAHELIAGVSDDPTFGPVIMFGSGGTSVEVVADTAVALAPLDLQLARDLIDQTRISRLLSGYRDRPPVDFDTLSLVLVRLSQLVVDCPAIRSVDINPLLADAAGTIALDARIEIDADRIGDPSPNERLAIRAYPNQWEAGVETRSGHRLFLRPIMPSDEALYADFIAGLSAEDIRRRFFVPRRDFSHQFIARFTQIDYARAMAFVALDETRGRLLGVARLNADPDYRHAEYAVIVRSDVQGEGVGWALMHHLIAYARAEGLEVLNGSILADNHTMLRMCAELGFAESRPTDDPSIVEVTLRLREG